MQKLVAVAGAQTEVEVLAPKCSPSGQSAYNRFSDTLRQLFDEKSVNEFAGKFAGKLAEDFEDHSGQLWR